METISALLGDLNYRICLSVIVLSGLVRGFAGFGTGMIAGPAVAALFSPQAAVVLVFVIDVGPASFLIPAAVRQANWREVLPTSLGFLALLPAGIAFLKLGDPVVLRWTITTVIIVAVAMLWSGWAYRGPRTPPVSTAVGALSGFLGGSTSVAGPPVVLYWMAARSSAGIVRANMIALFSIAQFGTLAALLVAGLFSWKFIAMGLIACPAYLVALIAGMKLHDRASETTRRSVALTLVTAAAVLSAPALDGWFRP